MPASYVAEHFGTLETQRHAVRLGLWLFLCTEILMFGALLSLYACYYYEFEPVFRVAAGYNSLWKGTANTYILLTSSFLAVLAVSSIQSDRVRAAKLLVVATAALGVVFLGVKAWEYLEHFAEGIYPGRRYEFEALMTQGGLIFFTFYYLLTFLHVIHMTIGLGILAWLWWKLRRGKMSAEYHVPLELGTIYWCFVDVVWLVIWPIFYLVR